MVTDSVIVEMMLNETAWRKMECGEFIQIFLKLCQDIAWNFASRAILRAPTVITSRKEKDRKCIQPQNSPQFAIDRNSAFLAPRRKKDRIPRSLPVFLGFASALGRLSGRFLCRFMAPRNGTSEPHDYYGRTGEESKSRFLDDLPFLDPYYYCME